MLKKLLSFFISNLGSYLLCITQTVDAANADLTFECFKPVYEVGEYVILDLQEDLQTPLSFSQSWSMGGGTNARWTVFIYDA